jgi:hypothetical protein
MYACQSQRSSEAEWSISMWSKTVTDSEVEDELFNIFQAMHHRQASLLLLRPQPHHDLEDVPIKPSPITSAGKLHHAASPVGEFASEPSASLPEAACRLHKERRAPRPASPRICSFVLAPIFCSRADPVIIGQAHACTSRHAWAWSATIPQEFQTGPRPYPAVFADAETMRINV